MNLKRCFEYLMDFLKRIFAFFVLFICLANNVNAQAIEIRTYHDENEQLIKEIYFIESAKSANLTDSFKSYYINGTLEKKGFYKSNYPDSTWHYYYESGQLKMKGILKDGSNHGLWEYYYENGKINMAGMIIDSKREDTWSYYFENGDLKSQGKYNENLKTGIWNYFYEEGEIKAQAFYTKDKGKYKEFYNNGALKAEGIISQGQSDSTWVFYHESGNIKSMGDYSLGKRVGQWVYYYDGQGKSAEGNYVDGREDGKWIYYHENGEVRSEGALREGKKEGYWKIFGKDGAFNAEGVFNQNDGKYTEFYESGNVKAEGDLLNGKNHGLWVYYYEDGVKEGECKYVKGNGNYIGFYKNGSVKMKGDIKDGVNVGLWELFKENGDLAGYYRPYYEDNKPIYKLVEKNDPQKEDYVKPAYRYKNTKSRYYDPVINEYKGNIIATNPFATLVGHLPVSFEHYYEERLGYEVIATLYRNPFYQSFESVELNEVYDLGFSIALRQKFYHPEGRFGMFYFGHEIVATVLRHQANVIDSVSSDYVELKIKTEEARIEYGLFIGDRWMRLFGERYKHNSMGFTIDAYIGFAFGYRFYQKKYPDNPAYDNVFKDVNDSKFVISPRLGLNIGFVF